MEKIKLEKNKETLNSIFDTFHEKFKKCPEKYLTESDIQADLFNLFKEKDFKIHSEIYFNKENKRRNRVDLVIFNENDITNYDDGSFKFKNSFAVIEIKLNRGGKKKLDEINEFTLDYKKIKRLHNYEDNDKTIFYSLYFSKKSFLNVIPENYKDHDYIIANYYNL